MNRFEKKVCLVTGGGSGIGRATCERFAAEGGLVVVVDRDPRSGNQTVTEILAAAGQAIFIEADVSVAAQIRHAVQRTVERWSRVDVLVNNAAIMTFKSISELEESAWDILMAVNLRAVFLFCQCALPHMPPGSAIINVSSVHAHETTANVVPYATSKGGIEAFTRGLSRELEARKVRVNCVDPGAVNTPMLWNNPNIKDGTEKVEGAVGEPHDIAAAICFLASDDARFINGASLPVDGGRLSIL